MTMNSISTLIAKIACDQNLSFRIVVDENNPLQSLAKLLFDREKCFSVARAFAPLLPQLLELCIEIGNDYENFVLFSSLIGYFQYATQFVYRSWGKKNHAPLPSLSVHVASSVSKRRRIHQSKELENLLEACLVYLWYDFEFFINCFDWSFLMTLETVPDDYCRFLLEHNMRLICNLPNDKFEARLNIIPLESLTKFRLRSVSLFKTRCAIDPDHHSGDIVTLLDLMKNSLSPSIVNVNGILMRRIAKLPETQYKSLIMVDSMYKCMRLLAEKVASAIPCLIEGPVGYGKSALVENLARITGHSSDTLIKVQMGDQVDSKNLIGNYHCTEIPGEFVWKPGPLTDSMLQGNWLLIEDIDAASPDVISTIVSALKSRKLSSLPGCNATGHINGDFRIFFTRRTSQRSEVVSEIDSIAAKITIDCLTVDELRHLLMQLHPSMKPLFNSILQTFTLAQTFVCDEQTTFSHFSSKPLTSRCVSLRDLLKWVKRISTYHNREGETNLAARVFCDAIDCFIPDPIFQMSKVETLGTHLNLSRQQAKSLCSGNPCEPTFDSQNVMCVGRARLKRAPVDRLTDYCLSRNTSFALTTPTLLLMERIAASLSHDEPVLLVGETGCGKTSVVQYLADCLGHKLTVINLNQQSDSADLIGGYKPVDLSILMDPIRASFNSLVRDTFSKNNDVFLQKINQCFAARRYKELAQLVINIAQKVASNQSKSHDLKNQWKCLATRAETLLNKFFNEDEKLAMLAFAFVEGSLVKCVREGSWILLDEINLAEADTLHSLSALLDTNPGDKVTLVDKADGLPIIRHPNFRVFACMNPATDIGKRDLPLGIRHRFTEFYVDEITQTNDLNLLVQKYLPSYSDTNKLVQFYLAAKELAVNRLVDSVGHRPHYSLRTLCRALATAACNPCKDVSRSLFEAFSMSFLTQLSSKSKDLMCKMIISSILGDTSKAVLQRPIAKTQNNSLQLQGFWIPMGSEKPVQDTKYIFTDCVKQNLKDLARAVSIGAKFPILIQGETSVGKTSLINWLARASGNVCRRVNNHEHTDLEEYIGSYVTDESGSLVFKEGILVEAMRKGYWIILDELNLAPTEILEALNRLLDDNRELFIAETRTVVKAHPSFLLFATQNPPGLYGGRKMLSRAFRNRFIELHFDEIPKNELAQILEQRCSLPKSYAMKMVKVMTDLQMKRRSSHIFAGKAGFITLRDLFRWGDRHIKSSESITDSFYDWDMHLASNGYMLLAGKVRTDDEANLVRQVLESNFLRKKQTLDPIKLIDDQFQSLTSKIQLSNEFAHLVPTPSFKRLLVFLWNAFIYKEPVLLVGQTGCGKTTACQLYSALHNHPMATINCHMNSDGSDFLGSLRPMRDHSSTEKSNKLFEWVDGPLVEAMRKGLIFLIDEISLADDSVLERLNSLLETERTLFLAEKSGADHQDALVVAHDSFLLAATMNPGDDFGKKELSPALRNRFTEIWCSNLATQDEFEKVILQNLGKHLTECSQSIARTMSCFYFWFEETYSRNRSISFRDILSWIDFVNKVTVGHLCIDVPNALLQGAHLVLIDSLSCNMISLSSALRPRNSFDLAQNNLKRIICETFSMRDTDYLWILEHDFKVSITNDRFGIHPFFIKREIDTSREGINYSFDSLGVSHNCLKLLRAMQLRKPILLEGSPGVGKTSMVTTLAHITGHKVVRINLSEQSDIADLFGSDLPIEGDDTAGKFEWRDGPLLLALRSSDTWIILDELNLAPQSVLEGLNSCLDHRGELYIPELAKTFTVNQHSNRIFATQNPLSQGGDRRGLPRSFLNRFTNVYIEPFTQFDLITVAQDQFPKIGSQTLTHLVKFNQSLVTLCEKHLIGLAGGPFDFNLRDISRVCLLLSQDHSIQHAINLIYVSRFRTLDERKAVIQVFQDTFNDTWINCPPTILVTPFSVTSSFFTSLSRRSVIPFTVSNELTRPYDIGAMQQLITCINMNWLAILVAQRDVNVSRIAEKLAILTGNRLVVFPVHPELDALELLGGFEKKNMRRHINFLIDRVRVITLSSICHCYCQEDTKTCVALWNCLVNIQRCINISDENLPMQELNDHLKGLIQLWPTSIVDTCLLESIERLVQSIEKLSKISLSGTFEWVDSQIVSAAKEGHWLLIDGANLCAASVLDRLNSLFEPEGFLLLSEKGSNHQSGLQTVLPHPNFRVIMTVDPSKSEMSRAMRNRGVEIFVDPYLLPSVQCVDTSALAADPVLARVVHFDLSNRIVNNQLNDCTISCLFMERSSPADFSLRCAVLHKSLKISSDTKLSLPNITTNNDIYEPFDKRTLFSPNSSADINDCLNFWCLKMFIELNRYLECTVLVNSPLARILADDDCRVSERQLFLLRLYGITRFSPICADEGVIAVQLARRLSSRLQEHCHSLVSEEDVFDCNADAWERLLFKSTVSNSLVYDAVSADALSRLIDLFYMYRSNIEKYTQPLHNLFSKTAQSLYRRLPSVTQLIQELTSHVSHPAEISIEEISQLTHHEASLFSTVKALLFDRQKYNQEYHTLHPLAIILKDKQSSSFTSECLLYHLLDSRLFFDYCYKLNFLEKPVESPSILSILLCRIITSHSFKLQCILERTDLLKSIFSFLLSNFTLLTADESSGDFTRAHVTLLDEWLNHLLKYETRDDAKQTLFTLKQSSLLDARSELQLGLVTCQMFLPISECDPSELKHHELNHLKTNLSIVDCEIDCRTRLAVEEMGSQYDEKLPLFLSSLKEARDHIVKLINEVSSSIVFRTSSRYHILRGEIARFSESVLKPCKQNILCDKPLTPHLIDNYARSCASFATSLLKDFVDYYDIINPFVTGLLITAHALETINSTNGSSCPALDSLINLFSYNCNSLAQFGEKTLLNLMSKCDDSVNITNDLTIHLLGEVHLKMASNKCDKVSTINQVNELLRHFVQSWHAMKNHEKALKEAEDALVHYRTHESAPDDDEIDAQTLAQTFPSFSNVFSDIIDGHSSDHSDIHMDPKTQANRLTQDKLEKIVTMHSDLLLKPCSRYFESTLHLRYNVVNSILRHSANSVNIKNGNTLALHLVSLNDTLATLSSHKDLSSTDVYHESQIGEIAICCTLLTSLNEQVESMLLEFTDHPTLTKVSLVTKRILSFDPRAPLMKFLTGLELLLEVMQDWNKNYAHREIKLTDHLTSITELIIKWRKIELNQWAHCLDRAVHKIEVDDRILWWFHLFNLLDSFETCEKDQVVLSLRQLMAGASLATFHVRLELIQAFSNQTLLIEGRNSRKFILLENVVKFYAQCKPSVDVKVSEERSAIDKQLQQFVSLMRWTDMNYSSLRDTIHKSHKTLIRYMKKLERSISQPSIAFIVLPSSEKFGPGNQSALTLINQTANESSDCVNSAVSGSLDGHDLSSLFSKMKKFTRKLASRLSLIQSKATENEECTVELISRMDELQKLSVDPVIKDKDEYTKAAHHVGNLKRKALSDLFKFLTESGFKWSSGSKYYSKCRINDLLMTVEPIKSAYPQLDALNDKYYYTCLFRFEKLQQALLNPCKDLNATNLSRIMGFAGYFLLTLVEQRRQISTLANLHTELSASLLISSCDDITVTSQQESRVRDFIVACQVLFSKIKLFVRCAAANTDGDGAWTDVTGAIDQGILAFDGITLPSPASKCQCKSGLEVCNSSIKTLIASFSHDDSHIIRELSASLAQSEQLEKELDSMQLPPSAATNHASSFLLPLLKSVENLVKLTEEMNDQLQEQSPLIKLCKLKENVSLIQSQALLSYVNLLKEKCVSCPDSLKPFQETFLNLLSQMLCTFSSVNYSMAKQFHILFNLFHDLATRGLCLPPDLDDGKATEGEGIDKDGIGLDEGQGRKDVSDQITSQDQLEGLMKDAQQEAQTDDVPEEENAVDFDGDFDGKEFDKSGDEGDNEQSDSDAEKQMGNDVTDDDNVLDTKMWKDDESSDKDEDISEDAEDTGKGEEYGEDKIVAKDDTLGNRSQDEEEEDNGDGDDTKKPPKDQPDLNDNYEGENVDPFKSDPSHENMAKDEEIDLGDIKLEDDDDGQSDAEEENDADTDADDTSMVDDETTSKMEEDTPMSDSEVQDDCEKIDPEIVEENDDEQNDATTERLDNDLEKQQDEQAQPANDPVGKKDDKVQSVECNNENDANQASEDLTDDKNNEGNSQGNGYDDTGAPVDSSHFTSGSTKQLNNQSQNTEERSISHASQTSMKKRTIRQRQNIDVSEKDNKRDKESSEMFRHIADDEKSDDEVMDTAVDEEDTKTTQAVGEESCEEQDDVAPQSQMEEDDEAPADTPAIKKYAEKVGKQSKNEKSSLLGDNEKMDVPEGEEKVGDIIRDSHNVNRGGETSYHTNTDILAQTGIKTDNLTRGDESMAKEDRLNVSNECKREAALLWSQCSHSVDSLVFELCQQLQLVLEPAKCAKLKGDYRSGKRINMRKVIAFIASQFRKDKIWLRRTKPSKRTYQIVLAVDDSGSMIENQCKTAAVQSLALLSRSLSLIEVGQLAVVRFGENPVIVHGLDEQFTESQGPRILESFSFVQDKTNIAALVTQVSALFSASRSTSSAISEFSQLLIVISDGRGIFNEGQSSVQTAVRQMIQQGIFCVFLLLDNPCNQQSIFDIESFSFADGKLVRSSYMDEFPFPFYLVVRDIKTLPAVLGQSLRQWFQLVTQHK